jgi:hypothetical protein
MMFCSVRAAISRQALSYSTRHLRMGPSSLALRIPTAWGVSSSILRSFTKLTSSSSSILEKFDSLEKETEALKHLLKGDDPLQEVQQEIRAVKYCLDNFGNITLPDGADKASIQLIQRYRKFKVEDDLVGMLDNLQAKETKLLPSNTAAVSEGMEMIARVIRCIMYILFFYVMPFNK